MTSRTRRQSARFLFVCVLVVCCVGRCPHNSHAQETKPLFGPSSNLSSALPPGEWSRVETAVDRALAWLASQQAEDGRFPSTEAAQPAVTSFAVMAFLSRGHMPDEGRYGKNISRAIDFVLSTQRRRGYFSLLPVTPPANHLSPSQTVTYNHAIAGLMLGEVYGMTSAETSRQIEGAIQRALIYHREVQTRQKSVEGDFGGWRYGYPEGPNASSDMSVTGWALMFLRSARNAEFRVPKEHFDEGLDFVERCYEADPSKHKKGVFRYRPQVSDPTGNPQITLANTASSMLTLILGGRHEHPSIAVGAEWFRSRPYPRPWQDGYFYLASYYSSQAMAQVGGDMWNQIYPPDRAQHDSGTDGRRGVAGGQRDRTQLRFDLFHFAGGSGTDPGLPVAADLSAIVARCEADVRNARMMSVVKLISELTIRILLMLRPPLVICLAFSVASCAAAERPNIIVILSDDMGYSDIGCYGSEIDTPVLNGLADNGLRFTQFYNTARCCPTRASLLTGLYPHQAGVGHMMSDSGFDGYRGELNRHCMTMAEVLKTAGYGTCMAGKWHVTKQVKPDGPKDNWPRQRGFDRFYGTIHGAGSFYDPNSLTRDNTQISPHNDSEYQPETYYYTDAISDHAVRFISEHHAADADQPFFMYVAYTAAHWPMHALPDDIAKYKGRYDEGYAAFRNSRLERMQQLGVVPTDIELSPQAEDWEKVQNREWEVRCMEVYAAMIDRMDRGIGKIISSLKQTDRYENTLVLFLQDNGGCAENLGRSAKKGLEHRPANPDAPMSNTELQFDMIPRKTRDGWPLIEGPGVLPGPADTYIAYGRGWANVSNTPFREYKHWVHEGGISTPLIAHWPAGLKRHGELEHQPGHLIDVMATCVDLSGAEYPKSHAGKSIKPLEGRSLRPTFNNEIIEREAIYWEHEGNRAIRSGDWKLVAKGVNGPWELYNIRTDRSELHNQAQQEPTRVRILSAMWQKYAERANVLPLTPYNKRRNSGFSKKKKFTLNGGADLSQNQSPMIRDKAFSVSVKLKSVGTEGVLVAQGGTAAGYSLYQKDGKLWFAVRRGGKLFTVSGTAPSTPTTLELRTDH